MLGLGLGAPIRISMMRDAEERYIFVEPFFGWKEVGNSFLVDAVRFENVWQGNFVGLGWAAMRWREL